MIRFALQTAIVLTAIASMPSFAQSAGSAPADNSRANQSAVHQEASADAQKNDSTDLSLTRRIRRSVTADKSLSTYGHNVKIVSVGGRVTLNGAVASYDEKASIHAKAVSIAGKDHVVDRMTVTVPKS